MDGLAWAIGGFDNRDLAFFIALLILLGALAVFLAMHLRGLRPWVNAVRRLTGGLGKIVADQTATPEQRIALADGLFGRSPGLLPLWQPSRVDLRPSPQANGYRNLLDPRQWFAVEAPPGPGYEQWCGTLAGVLLTLGLLFSVIGLPPALL